MYKLMCISKTSQLPLCKSHTEICLVRWINARPIKKFQKKRRDKVKKIELPDWETVLGDRKVQPTLEEMKRKMKKMGLLPPRRYDATPINLQCTGGIFDPYIPPEGDGKASLISRKGVTEKYSVAAMKTKSVQAVRKIRETERDFKTKLFGETALDVYIRANQALVDMDEEKLHELVTEKAFMEMMNEVEYKTIRWRYLRSLEPLRVVHVRCTDMMGKDNVFAQCTVRINSQQLLVVYDRFGRLVYGSESVPKNVLEYVVLEKFLSSEYGAWRVHGKVVPDWMPQGEALWRTTRVDIPPAAADMDEGDEKRPRPIRITKAVRA